MAGKETKAEAINLADVAKQVEEMLAKAKAEAEKIVADAKASVGGELTAEQKEALEKEKAYYDELVPVELFKDNHKYKDDVFVSVNGDNCVIKRGEKVLVKRKFKEVLDNAHIQGYEASKFIEQKSNEFARSEFN